MYRREEHRAEWIIRPNRIARQGKPPGTREERALGSPLLTSALCGEASLTPLTRCCYWIWLATWLNLLLALLPRRVMAAMQTTAIRATSRAYSTRADPRSLRPNSARRYGARLHFQ